MTAVIARLRVGPEAPELDPADRRVARLRSLASWAVLIACIGLWAVTLRPTTLNGPASFVGVDGISMEPTFSEGDLVVVRDQHTYVVGDVVAYRIPEGEPGAGHQVIHRIVGGNGTTGYTTQGDHNGYTDVWHPVDDDVIGKVWIEVPNAAAWLSRASQPGTLALLVGAGAFVALARRRPS